MKPSSPLSLAAGVAAVALASTASAFAPARASSRPLAAATASSSAASAAYVERPGPLHATLAASDLARMSKQEQLDALGVTREEDLALGIDPDEVLEFIGTRDDLVAKFRADIPQFAPAEAEAEVDKFLMDGEMLDVYIKFQRRKAEDPNWNPEYPPEREPNVVVQVVNFFSQYFVYFVAAVLIKDAVEGYLGKTGGS